MNINEENHIVTLYSNGDIVFRIESSVDERMDKVVALRRIFKRKTGGQQLFSYFETEIIFNSIDDKENFKYGNVVCRIARDQYWGTDSTNINSMYIDFEVSDLLNTKSVFQIRFNDARIGFNKMKEVLEIINRVGTIQGTKEILNLESKIKILQEKYDHLTQRLKDIK